MREAGITEIIATDTIEGSASIVSVAEIVAEALRKRK
jgi:phosphoribosylpyrophosphate synthetase